MSLRRVVFGLWALLSMSAGALAADPAACSFVAREGRGSTSDVLQRLVGRSELNDQRGLGGTGVIGRNEERGLGGTGIIGVVTGFASVCVNGYEVELNPMTEVTVEGMTAKQADVQLGQLVEIEALSDKDALVAARIAVRVAVAGPIESISDDARTLLVAGQTVSAAGFGPNGKLPRLRVGDWVAVSGLHRADGTILGSSIVKLNRGQRVLVSGELQSGDNGKLRLGKLTVDAPGVSAGQRVVLRGELAAETLITRETRLELGSPFSPAVRSVSIQADARRVEAELSRLSGGPVRLNEDLVSAAARSGDALQAEGRLDGRTFTAQRVTRPTVPATPELPARSMSAPIGSTPQGQPFPNALVPRGPGRPDGLPDPRSAVRPDPPAERPGFPQRPDVTLPDRPIPPLRPDIPNRR